MLYEGIEVNTQQSAESRIIGSPVGGLNGRDSLANMPEIDAYLLDNIFPGTASCSIRQGCEQHQDPLGDPVSSLEVYSDADGDKLLAFAFDTMYDVTAKDAPVTLRSDLASDKTVATMFSTVADHAQFLIVVTGLDTPFSFDGTVATDLVITGTIEPSNTLNYVCSYMGRLFFAARDKLGFYYLPPGQIQGEVEFFDLAQLSHDGGYVQAIATYSEDAGDGPHDYIVFITNRGEYIMFFGTDPGDATAWGIVGRYKSAEPIMRKCVLDYAGDLIVLTTQGVLQFSQIRKLADSRYEATALTSKLGNILHELNIYADVHGWSMAFYPVGSWLLVSVPGSTTRAGTYYHFVMNTITNAWTRFFSNEWNGQCWAVANKQLFFGRFDGTIRIADKGLYDIEEQITFNCKQAYNYMGTPTYKHFKWAQFLFKSEAAVVLSSQLSVDYKEATPVGAPTPFDSGAGAVWDVSFWDTDYWGVEPYTQRWIQPYGAYGVVASHWLTGSISGATFEWYSTEHVFEKASGLLG